MATALDTRCPICLDSWVNPSYVVPCLHRFCFACIQRWAESKPECPLCKGRVSSIVHLVKTNGSFEELVMQPPAEALVIIRLRGRIFSLCHAAALQTEAVSLLPRALGGGFQRHMLASLFREHPALIQPLLPWVRQELGQILGDNHCEASVVENLESNLSVFGLDEQPPTQRLQAFLPRHTSGFVHQFINIAVEQCNEEAHHLLDTHAARGQEGRSEHPSHVPSLAIPTSGEQKEPQEMSEGPSTSSQRSEPAPARTSHRQKRRTSSRASSPPNKRPCCHLL